jgi:3-oxoacyl-[acyl-carrier-protein] synthase II
MLLAGAVEAPLPQAHNDHAESEAGAAVLVLEPRGAATARGVTGYGTCRGTNFFLSPASLDTAAASQRAKQTVTDALSRLLRPNEPGPSAHLVAGEGPVGAMVAEQLRACSPHVEIVRPRAGSLLPLLHVASVLARGDGPALVATACQDGSCAVTLVRPQRGS